GGDAPPHSVTYTSQVSEAPAAEHGSVGKKKLPAEDITTRWSEISVVINQRNFNETPSDNTASRSPSFFSPFSPSSPPLSSFDSLVIDPGSLHLTVVLRENKTPDADVIPDDSFVQCDNSTFPPLPSLASGSEQPAQRQQTSLQSEKSDRASASGASLRRGDAEVQV
ncbi:hypothetical protein KUCAC02_014415, partial [Chaenocephalus aceratus]